MMKQHSNGPMLALTAVGMLALAGCSTTSPNHGYGNQGSGYSSPGYSSPAYCADCGIVTRIEYTIQDQCILARFQIECISVLRIPGIDYLNIIHCKVFT